MALIDALLLDPAPFEVWIANRTDGIKGCGTISDPYDGSTQARFDGVMQAMAAQFEDQPVAIHLGPGEFETKGYPTSGGWQIKAGMRIIGSGIDLTTLKLVDVGAEHGYAVGHDLTALADSAEVSDLTIDCNLESPAGYTVHGAVRLMGRHVRVQRVKAIHWGGGAEVSGGDCTVFSIITMDENAATEENPELAELPGSGFDGCIAVERASNRDTVVTVFQIGRAAGVSFTREFHGNSPYIRNCYVDGDVTDPDPAEPWVTAIAASWCRGGVIEGNHIFNVDVGAMQSELSSRDLIVRNNFIKSVAVGIAVKSGAGASVGSGTVTWDESVATVEVDSTALLQVGDRVRLTTSPSTLSGVYVVTGILNEEEFTVATPLTTSDTASVTGTVLIRSAAQVIVEGNIIELTSEGGAMGLQVGDDNDSSPYPEAPDYVHGDIILRNNKVRYVNGVPPPDDGASLIDVSGAKHLIVQSNVVDTIEALPLQNRRCGHATYFNNRTPGGVLLRGWDDDLNRKYGELETEAEDALVMAMFNER